jgi:hypothetical protein
MTLIVALIAAGLLSMTMFLAVLLRYVTWIEEDQNAEPPSLWEGWIFGIAVLLILLYFFVA